MIPKKQKPKTSCWARLFCCCLSSAFAKKDTLKKTNDDDDLDSFKYTERSNARTTNFQEDDSATRSNSRN